jgi:NAD+ kinase
MLDWACMVIKKIGILYHPMVETTSARARELSAFLTARGVEVWSCSAWETEKAESLLDGTDLILANGGDGTLLRAAQVALNNQTPITGINMGNLGFLTEFKADEALSRLPELLAGNGWVDERFMLEASLITADGVQPAGPFYALNDVVLARGAIVKLIQVETSIDHKPVTTYRADGIILSSATGSTSYAMAAGGPVLYPHSADFLLVPIVPHLSAGYSLVVPSSGVVDLKLTTSNTAVLSIDGHINIPVSSGAVVTVKISSKKTRFLRLREQNYFFNILDEKLRGKK